MVVYSSTFFAVVLFWLHPSVFTRCLIWMLRCLQAGAIIADQAFLSKHGKFFFLEDWGYLFLLYIFLVPIRALVVMVCAFYFRKYGHGLDARTCSFEDFIKKMFVVTWGGLRGAVGLVLALSVNADPRYREVTADIFFADRCLVFASGLLLSCPLSHLNSPWVILESR